MTSRLGVRDGIITARNRNTEYFEVMIRPVSMEGTSHWASKIVDGRLALRFMGKTSSTLAEYDQANRTGQWDASAFVRHTMELERHPRTSGFYGQVERLQLVHPPSLQVLRPIWAPYCDLDISSLIDPSSDFSEATLQLAFNTKGAKNDDVQSSVVAVTVQFMAWPLPSRRSSGSSSGSSNENRTETGGIQQPAPESNAGGKHGQSSRPACFPWKLSSLWRKPSSPSNCPPRTTAKAPEVPI